MVRVTPIKLQAGTKVLWFDPSDIDVKKDDNVIVSTERGTEFGIATADIMEVSDELIEGLKSPLKPVLRVANEEDIDRAAELAQQGEEALSVFKELAAEANEDMRPVMVEFLFDGEKAVFYFEADERIDFRDLVRQLAGKFHVRVDMRQIGVRDGARMVGGLGHCGQELCCKRLGGEFSPVSIRMAKEQNLSLNPQKISGCCGRLMCCLRYEYEAYKEVNARAPKMGAKIEVPGGVARVTEINVPLERVTLQLEDGKAIKVPLDDMEVVGEGKRPNRISREVFDTYAANDPLELFEAASFEVAHFTGSDKLADPATRSSSSTRDRSTQASAQEDTHRKPRRRRRSVSSGSVRSEEHSGNEASASADSQDRRASGERRQARLNAPAGGASNRRNRAAGDTQETDASHGKETKKNTSSRRPRRTRSKQSQQKVPATRAEGREQQQSNRVASSLQSTGRHTQARDERASRDHANANKQRAPRRPGRKSSGIRNAPEVLAPSHAPRTSNASHVSCASESASMSSASEHVKTPASYRKPRRRSHKAGGEGTTHEQ